MHPITYPPAHPAARQPGRRRHAAGFTFIEIIVVVTIISVALAIGVPSMMRWHQTSQAQAAVQFYAEGLVMAKRVAMGNNGVSRFVLTDNATSGQFDWQVDVCFPFPGKPCNSSSSNWSTPTAPAPDDPAKTEGFKSVVRSADALPPAIRLTVAREPLGSEDIYFIASGWVDTGHASRLELMRFSAKSGKDDLMRPAALHIALAGDITRCDPTVVAPDSRACP